MAPARQHCHDGLAAIDASDRSHLSHNGLPLSLNSSRGRISSGPRTLVTDWPCRSTVIAEPGHGQLTIGTKQTWRSASVERKDVRMSEPTSRSWEEALGALRQAAGELKSSLSHVA